MGPGTELDRLGPNNQELSILQVTNLARQNTRLCVLAARVGHADFPEDPVVLAVKEVHLPRSPEVKEFYSV